VTARLALGTAQFDGRYGRPAVAVDVTRIAHNLLDAAATLGIDTLDTAAGYGDSETLIGAYRWSGDAPRIVTKSPHPGADPPADWAGYFEAAATESLRRLERTSVYGYLCHSPTLFTDATDRARAVGAGLDRLRESGFCEKVGVSVYTRSEIDTILEAWRPDLIQLPLSVADQRLIQDGTLSRLAAEGIEVHARSVFLRGMLLRPVADLPAHLMALADRLKTIDDALGYNDANRARACLGFATTLPGVSRLVVGAENAEQLVELAQAAAGAPPDLDWDALALDEPSIVNPGLWPPSP
jgi:aryl-alcohol dehydrogenase-like predicted oxidoreductase